MKRLACALAAALLSACAAIPRPGIGPVDAEAPPYEAWARVLERHVDDEGRVDFSGLAANRADLDRFVAYVYDAGPGNRPQAFPSRQHVLAFHINAYNALAMHKVIETGIPETLAGLRKYAFFLLGKVRVGGAAISLWDYENDVIRPLGDARVHVALNCMAAGCPRLPREPFLAATLEAQLEREAHRFFNDPRQVRVDDAARVVHVSEILRFFPEDFLAHAPSLGAYVNRYRAVPVPEAYKVDFIPYDWTINRQPRR